MLNPKLHWIQNIDPYRLAVTPCPLLTIDLTKQVKAWHQAGIELVVSLLEPHEFQKLGVANESAICNSFGIRFLSLPICDHSVPDSPLELASLVREVHANLIDGKAAAIHCYAGIGRTGIVAACVLNELKVPVETMFDLLRVSRGYDMPESEEQKNWVKQFIRDRASAL